MSAFSACHSEYCVKALLATAEQYGEAEHNAGDNHDAKLHHALLDVYRALAMVRLKSERWSPGCIASL